MYAIILAGGYAKRLGPIGENKAKALIEIAGKPIINYIVEKLENIEVIKKIIVSTNQKFGDDFHQWNKKFKFRKVKIIIEPSRCEDEKLGAIGGIEFVIKKENIDDDIIIIGGDNLSGIDFNELIRFFKGKPVNALYDIKNIEEAKKFGVVKTDNNKIIDIEEKPEQPKSTLISMCIYIYPKRILKYFNDYIKEGNNKDSPGYFLKWLCKKEEVYGFVYDGFWFDIGDVKTLEKADNFMRSTNYLL